MQASVAAAMGTGVANRVLYKMALVPMGNYVFVLSQFQTFGYLLVYFGILATRYRFAFHIRMSDYACNCAVCVCGSLYGHKSAPCKQAYDHA